MKSDPSSITFRSRFEEIGTVFADTSALFQYARLPDGRERAANYLGAVYDAASCVFVAKNKKLAATFQKQLNEAEKKERETQEEFTAFCKAPDAEELEKPEMPPSVQRIQWLRVGGTVLLTGLGTVSLVALLQNSAEALADARWKALGISLSATLVLGTGMKSLIGCLPFGGWQNAFAGLTCLTGVTAGFGALIGNAHLYAPLSPAEEAALIQKIVAVGDAPIPVTANVFNAGWGETPAGEGDTEPMEEAGFDPAGWESQVEETPEATRAAESDQILEKGTDESPSFWNTKTGTKVMITTVTAEACLTAVLAFFWSRTRKEYRDAALSKLSGFKERQSAKDEARNTSSEITTKLLATQGVLEAVAAERLSFSEIGFARMTSFEG